MEISLGIAMIDGLKAENFSLRMDEKVAPEGSLEIRMEF
jgi:hypothetical protein